MLNQLLETKPVRRRSAGGTMLSFVVHAVVIAAAAVLMKKDNLIALPKPDERRVVYQPVAPTPPVVRQSSAGAVHSQTSSPYSPPVFSAPVTIDVGIPPVDLQGAPTSPGDFAGTPVAGGRPDGVVGASGPLVDGAVDALGVDKAAAALPGSPSPSYPEFLKASGVEGEAFVEFVVDTLGRAEVPSFRVLESTHSAFGQSVRDALSRMRFVPAEAGGRRVRMLARQRFAFALTR